MKWLTEKWKQYRSVALVIATLTGGSAMVYVTAIDGAVAVHDAARAQLDKAEPEQEQGGND